MQVRRILGRASEFVWSHRDHVGRRAQLLWAVQLETSQLRGDAFAWQHMRGATFGQWLTLNTAALWQNAWHGWTALHMPV